MLFQARAPKYSALIFTLDMPVNSTRYRDYRSWLAGKSFFLGSIRRFAQSIVRPRWAWEVSLCGRPRQVGNVAPVLRRDSGLSDVMSWMENNCDPSVSESHQKFRLNDQHNASSLGVILCPEIHNKENRYHVY